MKKQLDRLEDCADFERSKDPVEAVHDLRVATRRLRAFVEVLGGSMKPKTRDRAEALLRRVTRSARDLRDADVLIGLLRERKQQATTKSSVEALDHLLSVLARRQHEAQGKLRKRMKKVDTGAVSTSVRAALDEALAALPGPWEGRLLALDRIRAAEALAPGPGAGEDAERLHELRIAVKKTRYTIEILEPLFPAGSGELLSALRALQDLLGSHHDLVVLGELVHDERLRLGKRRVERAHALEALERAIAKERALLHERFVRTGVHPAEWRRQLGRAMGPGARKAGSKHRTPPLTAGAR